MKQSKSLTVFILAIITASFFIVSSSYYLFFKNSSSLQKTGVEQFLKQQKKEIKGQSTIGKIEKGEADNILSIYTDSIEKENLRVEGILTASIYAIDDGKLVKKRELLTRVPIAACCLESTVQFNNKTGDFFYVTASAGGGGESGDFCELITCKNVLWRIDSTGKTESIFELPLDYDHEIDFTVDKINNIVLLKILNKNRPAPPYIETFLYNIDVKSKKASLVSRSSDSYFNKLTLSPDGKKLYEVEGRDIASSYGRPLILKETDVRTGKVQKIELQATEGYYGAYLSISPDGKFLAIKALGQGEKPFFIYSFADKNAIKTSLGKEVVTTTVLWSPDSKKVLYALKDQLGLYDIEASQNRLFGEKPTFQDPLIKSLAEIPPINPQLYPAVQPLGWSLSSRYILYGVSFVKKGHGVLSIPKLYDIFKEEIIPLPTEFYNISLRWSENYY